MISQERVAVFVPIKFRCSYCRQFLGISRAQAGGVVDCPSCGRSIRVPQLDGTVQPMADPELDLEDAHLARALDELARLVDAPVPKLVPSKSGRVEADENEAENQIPQPLLEPIPIEVPLPPTPVIIQPTINAVLSSPSENGAANDRGLLAELTALSAGVPAIDAVGTDALTDRPSAIRRTADASPLKISIVVLVTFVAGMLTERFVHLIEGLRRAKLTATPLDKNQPVDNELTGRVTYKTKDGEGQPDRGARILVFPQTRSGEVKLPVTGFRPSDDSADQLVANAALKALGGSAATADAEGRYRLPIEAGSYRILVLSHFQPRDGTGNDPTLDKLLAEYFDKPDELLGRVQHQFSPLRVKGASDVWDHSF